MNVHDKVILKSFNKLKSPSDPVDKSENYWILINYKGTVVQDPNEKTIYASFSKEKRVLVRFDKDIKALGLACHNKVANSLWILEADLEKEQ